MIWIHCRLSERAKTTSQRAKTTKTSQMSNRKRKSSGNTQRQPTSRKLRISSPGRQDNSNECLTLKLYHAVLEEPFPPVPRITRRIWMWHPVTIRRLYLSDDISHCRLSDDISRATEHGLHLWEKCESFGITATKHGYRLITAVSLHCNLSVALLLQSMAVVFYPQWYANLELEKYCMLESE